MTLNFDDLNRRKTIEDEITALEDQVEVLVEERKALDMKILDAAEWAGQTKFSVPGVGRFEVKPALHWNILKQDKAELVRRWKQDPELSAFVKEDVNDKKMKSEIQRCFEKNFAVPPLFTLYPETVLSFKPEKQIKEKKENSNDEKE